MNDTRPRRFPRLTNQPIRQLGRVALGMFVDHRNYVLHRPEYEVVPEGIERHHVRVVFRASC
jgi:hypothetical protein